MSRRLEFPRPRLFDEDYWLCRCEGFRVDSPTGRLGVVAGVRFGSRLDRPDELVVRGGLLGNRIIIIPVSEIVDVRPPEERIALKPQTGGHERLARLRAYLATMLSGG